MKFIIAVLALFAGMTANAASPQVELKTNMGTITIELYPDKAPRTVENFLQYVKDGHYKDTLFHRVIQRFMIQGGGFSGDFVERRTRGPIPNESNNGLRNATYTVAMARRPDPHSATAQFFINVANNPSLDHRGEDNWGYAVFGKVIAGTDVVDRIAGVETGPGPRPHQDVPRKPVVIEEARIVAAADKSAPVKK